MEKTIVLRPRLSEKSYAQATARGVYVIDVPQNTNKQLIASAISAQFGVSAVKVNIVNIDGKRKRTIRKGGRPVMGQRSNIKKAYVTLKEGQKLPFFDTNEDSKKPAKPKTDKKADKKEAK